jgi:sugar O-acyltransferase (sialic acid O-acetyltransferase NeuD family)
MDVVVFGVGQISNLAWYQLTHDSPHRVVAFTMDAAHRSVDAFNGLPVVPFEDVPRQFPPDEVAMFVPLSYRQLSSLRIQKYKEALAKGYTFVSYVSSHAKLAKNVTVGENCMIDAGTIVQPFSRIGNNCILRAAAVISHDVLIGDHCFISAAAVVGGSAAIGEQCTLALNCTVLNAVQVAPRCLIGAGAVLTSDTEENGVYVGVPARRQERPAS